MGVSISPEIFQEKIIDLLQGFKFLYSYIDNLLNLINDDWKYHLKQLELTITKLK